MKNIDITPELKISELLDNFPQAEEVLISIAPAFKKLQNPFLRKTIARVTTLRQASVVGNVSLGEIINKLCVAAGQNVLEISENNSTSTSKPEWITSGKIVITYNAVEDLNNGLHPINKVTKETSILGVGEIYELITPFIPKPLLDILEQKGYNTYSENVSENLYKTFICKVIK